MSSIRTPYLTKIDPKAATSEYYSIAVQLITALNQRFPKGSVNQAKVVKELNLSTHQLGEYLATLGEFGSLMEKITLNTPSFVAQTFADIIQRLDGSNCGLFASYAIGYLKTHHPKIPAEVLYLDGHSLIVFGRKKLSDRREVNTWGKKALFCDPWTQEIYHAHQLEKLRKSTDNLAVYNRVFDATDRYIGMRLSNEEHHLQGKPEVYTTPESQYIDSLFGLMVTEDEKRQKLELNKAKRLECKEEARSIRTVLPWSYAADLSNVIFKDPNKPVKIFDIQRQNKEGDLIFNPAEEAKSAEPTKLSI